MTSDLSTIPKQFGPWTITDEVIYSKNDVRILATTNDRYVLKIREKTDIAHDELGALCMIRRHRLNYAVHTPPGPDKFCGMTDTHIWYAMRRYGGTVAYDVYARDNWRRIAQDVLAFITQLHRSCHLVHMDIKVTNVLRHHVHPQFIVSDYELCDVPNPRLTRTYGPEFRYYYLAMGAELDKPLYSWRMDLTALGYMLAEITWNTVDNRRTTFQTAMFALRDASATATTSDEDLVALRDREMSAAHPTVLAYMRRIDEGLTWSTEAPPPEAFYRELLSFFR
jgi:hypothetical protein